MQSARTTAKKASSSNAAGAVSASKTTKAASANNAAARASASTTAEEACASNAAGRASASTAEKEKRKAKRDFSTETSFEMNAYLFTRKEVSVAKARKWGPRPENGGLRQVKKTSLSKEDLPIRDREGE